MFKNPNYLKYVAKSLAVLFLLSIGTATLVFAQGPAVPSGASQGGPAQVANPDAPAGAAQPGQASWGGMLLWFGIMFGVLYFVMIRPQQKKLKAHQSMLGELKHGDDVVTASGILGKVSGITEKVVTVEVASNVKIKILKSQIAQIVKGQVKELA